MLLPSPAPFQSNEYNSHVWKSPDSGASERNDRSSLTLLLSLLYSFFLLYFPKSQFIVSLFLSPFISQYSAFPPSLALLTPFSSQGSQVNLTVLLKPSVFQMALHTCTARWSLLIFLQRSLTKVLNEISTKTNPYRAPAVTSLQPFSFLFNTAHT